MIEPGKKIGILGGGQLGKMAAQAAATLGYQTHIFCPETDSPAFDVATERTQASYHDSDALLAFAKSVDVITFEFENIPHGTIQTLEAHVPFNPGWNSLYISQNRLREKRFAQQLGIETTPFEEIHTLNDLQGAMRRLKTDCLLKTVELGYDGKGQHWIDSNSNLEAIWETFEGEWGILEAFVPFEKEVSAIIARKKDGSSMPFPIAENSHKSGILETSTAPAAIDSGIAYEANRFATMLADSLEIVGLLAVEFFLTDSGTLLFNEMAPRPHNSGHWTLDGCSVSQFEQFIRAICDLPLIEPHIHTPVTMKNLIGSEPWRHYLNNSKARLHLYGKKTVKPGRKMGHVNLLENVVDVRDRDSSDLLREH